MRILPYHGRNNVIDGAIITFVNVTKMVEAEAHQRTLVEELNHRVRNMLTVVNSIANQTLAGTDTPKEFADAFSGRIQAMGAAYGLVSRESWGDVGLRAIMAEQLKPFVAEAGSQIAIDGPDVMFKPNASLALGLVIHELATNAAKHGALSNAKGRLSVTWAVEHASPPCLILKWTERGGPAAKSPSRKGFGSRLIERELKQTLRAKAKFDYGRAGFRAEIFIPLDSGVLAVRGAQ